MDERVHLTTVAKAYSPETRELGTVIGAVECGACGFTTNVLGHFTHETIVTCGRCGKTLAVVDATSS